MNLTESPKEYPICEHRECENRADEYCYPIIEDGEDDYPIVYYCNEHAADAGFCIQCKGFFAGIESYEFRLSGQPKGYCSDCWEHWMNLVKIEKYWKYYDPSDYP